MQQSDLTASEIGATFILALKYVVGDRACVCTNEPFANTLYNLILSCMIFATCLLFEVPMQPRLVNRF